MRKPGLRSSGEIRASNRTTTSGDSGHQSCGFPPALPGDGRGTVRAGLARLDGIVQADRFANGDSGIVSGGGQRAPGSWRTDGRNLGPPGGGERHAGLRFDRDVPPGGYAWWYVDALSDDGAFGLTLIAFLGSVFSPYYAWARRRGAANPLEHCALNVALYGPRGGRWAMTERGMSQTSRSASRLSIGPSAMRWSGDSLIVRVEERCAPLPRRLKGEIRLHPASLTDRGAIFRTRLRLVGFGLLRLELRLRAVGGGLCRLDLVSRARRRQNYRAV